MAVKQVERRICDYCDKDAAHSPCCLCHKDFCYSHGDGYRPGDWQARHLQIHLCDGCAGAFDAKLVVMLPA